MISFHTPGHKSKSIFLNKDLYAYDFTELDETDDLYHPSSCIKNTELELSKLYNTKASLISATGCTSCVQAMLYLLEASGEKVITGRNLHTSAINTMALLNIKPIWLNCDKNLTEIQSNNITAADVECAINSNRDAKAVYLTSPSYYGSILNLKEIKAVCNKYSIPLLIDSAHGSHLEFIDTSLSATASGADLVSFSWHKTLPSLTGSALLCINNEFYIPKAKRAMAMFASTSPSYPIMLSMDLCRIWLENHAKIEFSRLVEFSDIIREVTSQMGILLSAPIYDPLRITIKPVNIGISTKLAVNHFKNNKIEVEAYDNNCIIFILSPMDTYEDLCTLKSAIESLTKLSSQKRSVTINDQNNPVFAKPTMAISLNQAVLAPKKLYNLREASGKISAESVFCCPPGIPITIPGEIITPELISVLEYYGIKKIVCCANF